MEANVDEISRELDELTRRFADLGAGLEEAARALEEAGEPPAADLLEALAGAQGRFTELRAQTLSAAAEVGVPADRQPESLTELQPLLTAITEALHARARRRALEQVQQGAVAILDRVLEVIHGDDPSFPSLVACHDQARELRAAMLELTDLDSDAARPVVDGVRMFADLLTIVEHRDALDDEQYAQMEDSVSSAFGRALAMAASRGRLGFEGEFPAPSEPEPAPAPVASELVEEPPDDVVSAEGLAEDLTPEPAAAESPVEPVATLDMEPGLSAPATLEPLAVADASPAAEGEGDASGADETAQWWLAAWARWSGWKSTHDFAAAVREELGKYPYLLSVPIQKSPQYDGGSLAYGYSLLLAHAEKQRPGCVGHALNSLKPGQTRPVGEQLYEYLVAAARLRETYADFVRDALAAAVPDPGIWFQFRILESREDTRIGDTEVSGQRLAGDAQRYGEHRFKMTLPPLTARFVLVSAEVAEPRGAGFKLLADDAPSDSAWLASVPSAQGADAATEIVQIGEDGVHVTGLGDDRSALWVALFNPEPDTDRRYELSVFLRNDSGSPFAAKG
jgi:hypothetical protein